MYVGLPVQTEQTLLRPRDSLLHQEIQSPRAGSSPVPSSSSGGVPVPLIQLQIPAGSCVTDVGVLAHSSEEKG